MSRLVRKAVTLLASMLLGLLIVEAAVRVLDVPPRPLAPLPLAMYQLSDNPVIGFEYAPGYTPSAADPPGFANESRFPINRHGFRDHEYPTTRSPGTFRTIVLGDSTTAGIGVDALEQTYPKRLEALLNGHGHAGVRHEVLNMGVGGYHTRQETETLRVKGLQYRPDLVVVTVCVNDLSLHADGEVYDRLRRANPLVARGVESTAYRRLLRLSRLAFVIHYRWNELAPMDAHDQWYTTEILKGESTVRAGFVQLAELQRQHGFTAVVVILPAFDMPFSEYRSGDIHEKIVEATSGLQGLPVIDLTSRFAELDDNARIFAWDSVHMNAHGHDVMARILLPIVQASAGESISPSSAAGRPRAFPTPSARR